MSETIPTEAPADYQRDEQSEKLIKFMDKLHADEIFANEETKREYLNNLTFDEFKNLLMATNSLLRDIPVKRREIDGKTVFLNGPLEQIYPPEYEDKEPLLQELFTNVQNMNQENRSLEDIGILTSMTINAVHPFNDGNGRTSRLVYQLLVEDYDGKTEQKEELVQVLGEDGRMYKHDISPELLTWELGDLLRKNYLGTNQLQNMPMGFSTEKNIGFHDYQEEMNKTLEPNIALDKSDCDYLKTFFSRPDSHSATMYALFKFLKEDEQLDNYLRIYDVGRSRISIDVLSRDLTHEDVEKIKNNYREVRKLEVEILMDIIVHPDNYSVNQGEDRTVLDNLKQEIARGIENGDKNSQLKQ